PGGSQPFEQRGAGPEQEEAEERDLAIVATASRERIHGNAHQQRRDGEVELQRMQREGFVRVRGNQPEVLLSEVHVGGRRVGEAPGLVAWSTDAAPLEEAAKAPDRDAETGR